MNGSERRSGCCFVHVRFCCQCFAKVVTAILQEQPSIPLNKSLNLALKRLWLLSLFFFGGVLHLARYKLYLQLGLFYFLFDLFDRRKRVLDNSYVSTKAFRSAADRAKAVASLPVAPLAVSGLCWGRWSPLRAVFSLFIVSHFPIFLPNWLFRNCLGGRCFRQSFIGSNYFHRCGEIFVLYNKWKSSQYPFCLPENEVWTVQVLLNYLCWPEVITNGFDIRHLSQKWNRGLMVSNSFCFTSNMLSRYHTSFLFLPTRLCCINFKPSLRTSS